VKRLITTTEKKHQLAAPRNKKVARDHTPDCVWINAGKLGAESWQQVCRLSAANALNKIFEFSEGMIAWGRSVW
jgi:hypothetical protein